MDNHKLIVKSPAGVEFNYEGSETTLKELFKQWLALNGNGRSQVNNSDLPPKAARVSTDKPQQTPHPNSGNAALNASLMERIYEENDGHVSLKVLPKDPTDAVIILLYGYNKLVKQTVVSGIELSRAARKSGVQIKDRIYPILQPAEKYITTAGGRSGSKYGLNNPGLQYAEELLQQLLK